MSKNKTKVYKKVNGKLEVTTTDTEIIVKSETLEELQDNKSRLEKARQATVDFNNIKISKFDADIASVQENIDQAILLGVT